METRTHPVIDDLLADYLKGTEATPCKDPAREPQDPRRTEGRPRFPSKDPRREPTEEPPRVEAKVEAKREAKSEKRIDGELEGLLASYLEVSSHDDQDFSVPRSPEVDELLRLYMLEEKDVSKDLTSSLREHVRTSRETAEERAVTVTPPRGPSAEWSQTVAAQLRDTQDIDERVRSYAAAVAHEEERTHTFSSDHESTIKGVPPPNAPPIPLGSDLARQIKDQVRGTAADPKKL
jgi:hypothetical protein